MKLFNISVITHVLVVCVIINGQMSGAARPVSVAGAGAGVSGVEMRAELYGCLGSGWASSSDSQQASTKARGAELRAKIEKLHSEARSIRVDRKNIGKLCDAIFDTRRVLGLLRGMHGDKPLSQAALNAGITVTIVNEFLDLMIVNRIEGKADSANYTFLTDTLKCVQHLKEHAYPEEWALLNAWATEFEKSVSDTDIAARLKYGFLSGGSAWFRAVKSRFEERNDLGDLKTHLIDRGEYYYKSCVAGLRNPDF